MYIDINVKHNIAMLCREGFWVLFIARIILLARVVTEKYHSQLLTLICTFKKNNLLLSFWSSLSPTGVMKQQLIHATSNSLLLHSPLWLAIS